MMKAMGNNEIREELKGLGVRPSSTRVLVLKYLREKKNHPTIDQVYGEILESLPGLSRTSVYNTMNVLAEKDLVRTLHMDGCETRYDATICNHGHFKCTCCGDIHDFELFEETSSLSLPEGFQAERQDLIVWGRCARCASVKEERKS